MKIGKNDYVTVAERVEEFWARYGDKGSIQTEFLVLDSDRAVVRACVYVDGELKATGTAEEIRVVPVLTGDEWKDKKALQQVNVMSFIENCETSAVGRALGNFGIGTNGSIATADEVMVAKARQEAAAHNPKRISMDGIVNALATLRENTLFSDEEFEEYKRALWAHMTENRLGQDALDALAARIAEGTVSIEELKGETV